ncbi:hypothetical protein FISHEDRAFT_51437 [Fistulina hepatica ATCC 64428]|uniref:Uncharacterized protein n=1 Tax=Fistulina hepatica ATCC 64428 TaxID=1128425 RepID=A0A0D7A3I7_9AGAR|nr:hypothetical protein FISHEDRAFT_51437 [Fistulina hepatica ATCC 64428]
MFKNAAAKIAHNTTIPGLGANEFRQLQDLISQEKSVLISHVLSRLQRLSSDLTKANEALRTWGLAEGVDLGVSVVYEHVFFGFL